MKPAERMDKLDHRLRTRLPRQWSHIQVDEDLHQDIMGSVRGQAEIRRHRGGWVVAGAAATVLAMTAAWWLSPGPTPAPPSTASSGVSTAGLDRQLARLEPSQVLPEAALRQEYERLKADMRKLGIDT